MLDSLGLTIDGYQFGVETDDNVLIVCDKITGWYGGAGVKRNASPRPSGHGSFGGQSYRDDRVVVPSGWAYADSRGALMGQLMQIAATMGEGNLGTITVNDPDYGGELSCSARLSDAPQLAWDAFSCCWSWQLQFTTDDDPRLYGSTMTASTGLPMPGAGGLKFPLFKTTGKLAFGLPGDSGRVTLFNPGTADTFLTFTIIGPVLGGFSLTDVDSGRRIVYAGDVPDGATVLIVDTATGRVTLNGSDRTGELTSKQWWVVPAGGSSTVQFATLGASGQTGSMTASLAPAYW